VGENIAGEKAIATKQCNSNNGPVMDVFIMSYCPFGLQFVKGLLPVWREFKDYANINVRFVSYTMHGDKEAEENARMACIREEQCSSYSDYLECFVQNGDSAGCINKLNIDSSKLNDCIANRAKGYLDKDAELNKQYGVQGSPTIVINGKQVDVWPRSPANIAQTLCNAFNEKPEACSKSFSEENPGAGFGQVSTNIQGSCG